MGRKSFDKEARESKGVYDSIFGASTQNAVDAEIPEKTEKTENPENPEKREVSKLDESNTSKRGRKLKSDSGRVNLILSSENTEYVHTMCGVQGITMSEFVNMVLDRDRGNNVDLYMIVRKMMQQLNRR